MATGYRDAQHAAPCAPRTAIVSGGTDSHGTRVHRSARMRGTSLARRRAVHVRKLAGVMLTAYVFCTADPAAAASLTLAWDPPTDGITTDYVLLYGGKSGAYSTEVDVGNTTSYTVTGLAAGRTYYFTVRARSAAGLLSAPAAEVTGTTPGISPRASSAGDLNDDHVQDLLFQSTAGDLYGWYMSGTSLVSGAWLSPAQIDPEWRAVTVRDFTGDGHADLLLQN